MIFFFLFEEWPPMTTRFPLDTSTVCFPTTLPNIQIITSTPRILMKVVTSTEKGEILSITLGGRSDGAATGASSRLFREQLKAASTKGHAPGGTAVGRRRRIPLTGRRRGRILGRELGILCGMRLEWAPASAERSRRVVG